MINYLNYNFLLTKKKKGVTPPFVLKSINLNTNNYLLPKVALIKS